MKHLLVMVFLCLIILMYCYGGAAKKASTFSTCPIRWSNSFKGPPGFPGKPGQKGEKGEILTAEIKNLNETIALIPGNFTTIFAAISRGYVELDNGWISPLNGFQYKLLLSGQSWNNSRRLCQEMGGDLATHGIQDWEMRRIIFDALNATRKYWVGFVDEDKKGIWKSIKGRISLTRETALWAKNEPSVISNKICAIIYTRILFMSNAYCSQIRFALCQKSF